MKVARLTLLAALVARAALADPFTAVLTPSAGIGWSQEDRFEGEAVHARAGASFLGRFNQTLSAEAQVRMLFYRREYLGNQFSAERELSRSSFAEQKIDAEAFFLVDLARLFSLPASWRLPVGVGPGFRFFVNDALPSRMGGAAGRLGLGYAFSPAVDVSAAASVLYNFAFDPRAVASAVGGPTLAVGWHGGIGLRFAPNVRFGVAYEGELVTLINSRRLFQSFVFQLDLSL